MTGQWSTIAVNEKRKIIEKQNVRVTTLPFLDKNICTIFLENNSLKQNISNSSILKYASYLMTADGSNDIKSESQRIL